MNEDSGKVDAFNSYRKKMNDLILSKDNLVLRRFFNLDSQTYQPGALSVKTKEMLGLVASMVLRCDHCVQYHLQKCKEAGCSEEEIYEVFSVACVVGGSIVIPHLRKAAEFWELISENQKKES